MPLNAGIDLETGEPLEFERVAWCEKREAKPEQVLTTERLDELFASFPLTVGDNVWLVGGHEGLQIKFLLDAYPGIWIAVYEPQPVYVERLRNKYKDYPVYVHPYALGDATGEFGIALQDADCTFHWKHLADAGLIGPSTESLPMVDVGEEYVYCQHRPKFLMMNCEGSELEIIKQLSKLGYLKEIPCVLAQIHSRTLGIEGCQEAYAILSLTHDIKWRYSEWAWVYAEVKK